MELQESQPLLRTLLIQYVLRPFFELRDNLLLFFMQNRAVDDHPKDVESPSQVLDSPLTTATSVTSANGRKKRGRLPFFLTVMGTVVGLGQFWRFPALAYKNGGGTFLFLYAAMSFLFGFPLFFFELANGQYSGKNPLTVFDKVPPMKGIGLAMTTYSLIMIIYYNQISAFGIHYLWSSFNETLPWSQCPDSVNGSCFEIPSHLPPGTEQLNCGGRRVLYNRSVLCTDDEYASTIAAECCRETICNIKSVCGHQLFSAAYYWERQVINDFAEEDPMKGYIGGFQPKLMICSFVAWFSVYLLTSVGQERSGALGLVFASLMFVLLIGTLIFFTVSVPEAHHALGVLFKPRLDSVKNPQVWVAAAQQTLYSLGIAMGPVVTLGARSPFDRPHHLDSFLACLIVVVASVLSACVVFLSVGYLAGRIQIPFFDVMKFGPGLSFIAYSEVVSHFPVSCVWSACFFFFFACAGLTAVSGVVDSISMSLVEVSGKRKRHVFDVLLVVICYLFGVPIIMRGGHLIVEVLDHVPAGIALHVICLCEVVAIVYFYRLGTFCEDIAFMIGSYPGRLMKYIWILLPVCLIAVICSSIGGLDSPAWKKWVHILGYSTVGLAVSPIVMGFICELISRLSSNTLDEFFKAPSNHGPRSDHLKVARFTFHTSKNIL